jgi:micrococcal nuclease
MIDRGATKTEYRYRALVMGVVDGDTIDVKIDLGFSTYIETRLRLYGIDTRELKSKDEGDRILANKAKDYLAMNILGKYVLLESFKKDKYGRYLAVIHTAEGRNINQELLEQGYAIEYFGGTKLL